MHSAQCCGVYPVPSQMIPCQHNYTPSAWPLDIPSLLLLLYLVCILPAISFPMTYLQHSSLCLNASLLERLALTTQNEIVIWLSAPKLSFYRLFSLFIVYIPQLGCKFLEVDTLFCFLWHPQCLREYLVCSRYSKIFVERMHSFFQQDGY